MIPIARADLRLRERGETVPMRRALQRTPPGFDPGGAITTIAVRLAMMERDYDEAAGRLGNCQEGMYKDVGLCGFVGALDDYTVPREWYDGLVAAGRGDQSGATRAFERALKVVGAETASTPNEPKTLIMLGLIYAMLGRARQAVTAGERAVELLPISADALDGPLLATNLAAIYAQIGKRDRAVAELSRIVRLPGGPTPGTLRIEPWWDSVRDHPGFAELATLEND